MFLYQRGHGSCKGCSPAHKEGKGGHKANNDKAWIWQVPLLSRTNNDAYLQKREHFEDSPKKLSIAHKSRALQGVNLARDLLGDSLEFRLPI